ncbi:MAG: GDSL-type esterase/lipase family protein [Chloroflexota bacterium]
MPSLPSAALRRARPRLLPLVASALALLVAATPVAAAVPLPVSMASVGDSITRAYNTGAFPFTDNPAGSWSTGTTTSVVSHYARILPGQAAIHGRNENVARTGARMNDLGRQLGLLTTSKPEYVTILLGANDACAGSEAAMTSVADFRAQLAGALATFTAASPSSRILLLSIPDIHQLWSVLKGSSTARSVWSLYGICQSMLARPTSTQTADVERRARVRQRVVDYNAAIAEVCALHALCRTDGGAVFATAFTAKEISTRDYFHPSLAGQKKLAAVTWAVGWWGS